MDVSHKKEFLTLRGTQSAMGSLRVIKDNVCYMPFYKDYADIIVNKWF